MSVDLSLETILHPLLRVKAVYCRNWRDRMIEILIDAYRKKLSLTSPVVILFITVTIVFGGCAENYGRLQRSAEVDKIFKTYRVLPDHRYYFTGPEGRPDAIMG